MQRDLKRDAFNAAATAREQAVRLIIERDQARVERDTLRGEVASQAIQISELRRQRQEVADNVSQGE